MAGEDRGHGEVINTGLNTGLRSKGFFSDVHQPVLLVKEKNITKNHMAVVCFIYSLLI